MNALTTYLIYVHALIGVENVGTGFGNLKYNVYLQYIVVSVLN